MAKKNVTEALARVESAAIVKAIGKKGVDEAVERLKKKRTDRFIALIESLIQKRSVALDWAKRNADLADKYAAQIAAIEDGAFTLDTNNGHDSIRYNDDDLNKPDGHTIVVG